MKIILGGDFNSTVNDQIDQWPRRNNNGNSIMVEFMNERNLMDIW